MIDYIKYTLINNSIDTTIQTNKINGKFKVLMRKLEFISTDMNIRIFRLLVLLISQFNFVI
jgi:hypothetical protein